MTPANTQANTSYFPAADANPVIQVKGLVKSYPEKEVPAVNSIDFAIERGEIFGLIGPDGAGKTSTFHILGGIMEPSSGEVQVLGKAPRAARPDIGYLTQQFSLYLDMSIEENMQYVAGLREVSPADFEARKEQSLKQMNLAKFRNRLAGQLSGGMKQKLALCCALIARPQVLLLDEPTTGVDPVSRREFWDLLAEVSAEGVTIAVATPYLDEAERCNRVALMYEGNIKRIGTVEELKQNLGLHRLELSSHKLIAVEASFAKDLESAPAIVDVQTYGARLDLLVPDTAKAEAVIKETAAKYKLDDLEIEKAEPTLENVFIHSLSGSNKNVVEPFPFVKNIKQTRNGAAIKATNINKNFGAFQAVKNVSLDIGYGEIFGLLGANGAGKTTTIKMLCGLLEPSSGNMMLAGQTGALRDPKIRQRLGYMSQKFTLYDDLTLLENLHFYCGVYEVDPKFRADRIKWVLKAAELSGQEDMITGQLPGGWKQRLSFGACIMHEPEILFLDEPTSGVDPVARRQLWLMISDIAKHGTAVLVTTHFLEEAEHCQNLGFMVAGEVVAQGSPTEIKDSQPGELIELLTTNNQEASFRLKKLLAPWRVSIFANKLHVVLNDHNQEMPGILNELNKANINVISQRKINFSLEDSFIGIVQRAGGAAEG